MWWRRLGCSPEKTFVPKMIISFGAFYTVFNRQKTRTVTIEALDADFSLRFNCETILTKTVQKLSKNSVSPMGGGRLHDRPPPLNTPLC